MLKTINLTPIILTLAVTAGVLSHDMHLDKVTAVAIALPATLATYSSAHAISSNEHIHVERVSFSNQSRLFHSTLPKVTPRDNDGRYIQPKKLSASGTNTSLWPSV